MLAFRTLFRRQRFFSTRKYTKDHEWIIVENNVGTIGITDYAQKALGDVVYIEAPTVGDKIAQNGIIP